MKITQVGSCPEKVVLSIAGALFAGLTVSTAWHHEMWRDELQAWMIASTSRSLYDLADQGAYEPHTRLWLQILFVISRMSTQPLVMQLAHVGVAILTAFLFLTVAPFGFWLRILFVFGYFTFYEYAVISRPYAVIVFLMLGFCSLLTRKDSAVLVRSALLFLMAQSSVYGLILAIPLGAFSLVHATTLVGEGDHNAQTHIQYWTALGILVAGVGIAVCDLRMPIDFVFGTGIRRTVDGESLKNALQGICEGFLPFPKFTWQFWNSSLIPPPANWMLGFLFLTVSTILLTGSAPVVLLFLAGMLGQLLFAVFVNRSGMRHNGLYFMFFISCAWIASSCSKDLNRGQSGNVVTRIEWCRVQFLTVLLIVHVVAGGFACAMDWEYPFSASHDVAAFVRRQPWDDPLIIGYPDNLISPIAGYLRREFFYINGSRFGTFVWWDRRRLGIDPDAIRDVIAEGRRKQQQVVLVVPMELCREEYGWARNGFTKVAVFPVSVVADETYCVLGLPSSVEDAARTILSAIMDDRRRTSP